MSAISLKQPAILLSVVAGLTVTFCGGLAAGIYFYPQFFDVAHVDDEHDHDHETESEEEEDHVALTKQAFENLGLRIGSITRGDYWKSILIPGQVVEIPGRSDLSISAPVTGIVEEVNVLQGETPSGTKPLFVLRITDEALTDAQSTLLNTLARKQVVDQEILRLAPLTQSGAVSGGRKRELEYELQQLAATEATLIQEIRGRGLPETVLQGVLASRSLATTLNIQTPPFVMLSVAKSRANPKFAQAAYSSSSAVDDANSLRIGKPVADDFAAGYSIETLRVHPGKTVQRGDDLCSLAFHSELYIQGTAFDTDLETLERIVKMGWPISAEAEHRHGEHAHKTVEADLRVLRIDNHVDEATQTVKFYSRLPNAVEQSFTDNGGRLFQQWRYRPGQRTHLRLPQEKWTDQLLLPAEAVAVEGPDATVFVKHEHDHDHAPEDDRAQEDDHAPEDNAHHHDVFIELEPVPVRLLYRDENTAVIADDGQISENQSLALNNAYKLQLALQVQSAGGGGHHHDHEH